MKDDDKEAGDRSVGKMLFGHHSKNLVFHPVFKSDRALNLESKFFP